MNTRNMQLLVELADEVKVRSRGRFTPDAVFDKWDRVRYAYVEYAFWNGWSVTIRKDGRWFRWEIHHARYGMVGCGSGGPKKFLEALKVTSKNAVNQM